MMPLGWNIYGSVTNHKLHGPFDVIMKNVIDTDGQEYQRNYAPKPQQLSKESLSSLFFFNFTQFCNLS